MLITSLVKGNMYGSFLVVTLNFINATQIFSFPFFLGTTTIGDSQVASSTSLIKLVASNLSIPSLTIITELRFN